jgi:hypothetical protein
MDDGVGCWECIDKAVRSSAKRSFRYTWIGYLTPSTEELFMEREPARFSVEI